jgi:hypothetical protein
MRRLILAAAAVLFPLAAQAATYTIVAPGTTPGPGQFASMLALASANGGHNTPFIQPGDIIDVQAGTYLADEGRFYNIGTPANPVTFMAVGGTVYMPSFNGASNGKGTLVFVSSDVVVNGFVFGGFPMGSADNEAGIRLDVNYGVVDANGLPYPYNLTVKNSGFIMKADGILADDCSTDHSLSGQYGSTSTGIAYTNAPCAISIDKSYFAGNGGGGGLQHGIYIDRIDQLTVTNSLFMGGMDGHLIKSRAFNTDIENNTITEGPFAFGNTLIDFPVGGNETVKNNVFELGRYNDGNGILDYNTESYPPILNNVGNTVVVTGNTFIDDWSQYAGPSPYYYTASIWMDQSLSTTNPNPIAHSPNDVVAALTFTGNHLYGHNWANNNIWNGWYPSTVTIDSSNTIDNNVADAPAVSTTPPIAWPPPGTTNEPLNVIANGVSLPVAGSNPLTYYNPTLTLWWNGLPLTPAPVAITAQQQAGATQTLTYQVPVIPGSYNYLGAVQQTGGCCLYDLATLTVTSGSNVITVNFPGSNQTVGQVFTFGYGATTLGGITLPAGWQAPVATVIDANNFTVIAPSAATGNGSASTQVYDNQGLTINMISGSINGGPQLAWNTSAPTGLGGSIGGGNTALFPAGPTVNPPTDTTPPVIATNAAMTLAGGSTSPITSSLLNATDPDNTAAQITYTFAAFTGPSGTGSLTDNGVAQSTFTQADVNAGLVKYTAPSAAGSEALTFNVADPAGNSSGGTFDITVTSPGVHPTLATPVTLTAAQGVNVPITSTNLSATETNYTPAQLKYTITTQPNDGVVYDNSVQVVGAGTFSQADINAGLVTYLAPPGAPTTDSFAFSVADPLGNATTGTLPVSTPAPGAIVLSTPVGISVALGKSVAITSTNLSFTSTPYTTAENKYYVTTLPAHGTITDGGVVMSVNNGFSQADVNAGLVVYTSTGTAAGTDSLGFNAENPAGSSTAGTLPITITGDTTPPVVTSPAALSLLAGTTKNLAIVATDPDNTPAQLTWKVTTAPTKGTLYISGVAGGLNSTFTGTQMNSGLISYKSTGTVAASDSIVFSVTDPAGNSATATQAISITVDTTPPTLPTPVALTAQVGAATPITTTNLNASDPDNTALQLLYTVTTAPTKGTLKDNGVAATGFTQADIVAGLVTYTATASGSDSIAFSIADPAGNSVSGTLPITNSADTTPPVVAAFQPLPALSGTAAMLTLNATDPDNTAVQLTYTVVSAPTQGTIEKSGAPVTTFTQADVNNGLITYLTTSSSSTTDSVGLKVSDPAGNFVSVTLPIAINSAAPTVLPPDSFGLHMVPHPDGTWGWK